jgi:fyn-related kinase
MLETQMFFVTKFIERGSLKGLLSSENSRNYFMQPSIVYNAAVQICSALLHLHSHHIIHRDVAARNILVDEHNNFILSDLGLGRWINNNTSEYDMEKSTALPARWTAPDVLINKRYNEKSDIYSLAVTLWEMLTGGLLPHQHIKDNLQVIALISAHQLHLSIPSNCPAQFSTILSAMLHQDHQHRPSAAKLLEMLNNIRNYF